MNPREFFSSHSHVPSQQQRLGCRCGQCAAAGLLARFLSSLGRAPTRLETIGARERDVKRSGLGNAVVQNQGGQVVVGATGRPRPLGRWTARSPKGRENARRSCAHKHPSSLHPRCLLPHEHFASPCPQPPLCPTQAGRLPRRPKSPARPPVMAAVIKRCLAVLVLAVLALAMLASPAAAAGKLALLPVLLAVLLHAVGC